jgi:hypothetical protein
LRATDIKAMATDARAVTKKLAKADSGLKGDLYRALGVGVTYLPDTNDIEVVARFQRVCDSACRRADLNHNPTVLRGVVDLSA